MSGQSNAVDMALFQRQRRALMETVDQATGAEKELLTGIENLLAYLHDSLVDDGVCVLVPQELPIYPPEKETQEVAHAAV